MRNHKIISLAMIGLVGFAAEAQMQPYLSISKNSSTTVQVSWTNTVGTSYRIFSTPDITAPRLLWTPLADAFSDDVNVFANLTTINASAGFFSVAIPTNGTSPAVQIFSPTNNQSVSDEITVGSGAQIGSQLQGVNLYLDEALVGYLNSGSMAFSLDTAHFTNGLHTLYVSAVDTGNNITPSTAITLDFENPVRWLDACSLFNTSVPIDVVSDIYPADWLVSVTDKDGTVVRTISGTTSDGNINTSWDGTDNNGQPLAVENLYQIVVDVVESDGAPAMRSARTTSRSSSDAPTVLTQANSHGVTEYTVQSSESEVMQADLETLETDMDRAAFYEQLTPEERVIYPPLPEPSKSSRVTTPTKMSAREMFLNRQPAATAQPVRASRMNATPNGVPALRSGFTKNLVWWENSWVSRQIIVARVPITGVYAGTVENNCNQIALDIAGAAQDTLSNTRGVFTEYLQIIDTDYKLYDLTNQFSNPQVTAFYFYGHGNNYGNKFGTIIAGISAKNLSAQFGNYSTNLLSADWGQFAGKAALTTRKPFNFIFLDGCNTGIGDLPEAFGIPKKISGAALNEAGLHKRVYMGWSAPVVFRIDGSHVDWSLKFWQTWINGGSADKAFIQAKEAADAYRPSVVNNVPIKWYGNASMKWSD